MSLHDRDPQDDPCTCSAARPERISVSDPHLPGCPVAARARDEIKAFALDLVELAKLSGCKAAVVALEDPTGAWLVGVDGGFAAIGLVEAARIVCHDLIMISSGAAQQAVQTNRALCKGGTILFTIASLETPPTTKDPVTP